MNWKLIYKKKKDEIYYYNRFILSIVLNPGIRVKQLF